MTPSRPYLLRALYEWIADNGLTPYLLVDATHEDADVPQEFVEDGKIVLNISPMAVQSLTLENEWVSFSARFSGRPFSVYVPMQATLAIYARENGRGMFFQPEEEEKENDTPQPPRPPRGRPALKLVK